MESWVGPAIVAALISGLVSLVLVQLNFRQSRKLEQMRRDEKVRDFQIALRAEIASDLLNLEVADRRAFLRHVTASYHADQSYWPVVPRLARNAIFETIVKQIHILAEAVIAPVINYARLRQSVEEFVEDMRADTFRALKPQRQLLMYTDYLSMFDRLEVLAANARATLDGSLAINSSAAYLWSRSPAPGPDGASAGNSEP